MRNTTECEDYFRAEGHLAMTFRERLRSWRESQGWTQGELGDRLEVSEQTIGRYERGERSPKAEELLKLAELGCDPTWLVTGRNSEATIRGEPISPAFSFVPSFEVTFSAGRGNPQPDDPHRGGLHVS
ncbi:helix-turn-helix domain-containing protein, partial [Methylobrevis pamukkalensis]|uniref:helix-turn-helix domain-containing protein n=1 Tax=Methylobrevis pamukkalensis TaxID=1439726 RepID=UPI00114D28FF